MEIIVGKKLSEPITFSDLKLGDVFAHNDGETDKEEIFIKIDNKGSIYNALCVDNFSTYHTDDNSKCYLISSTLTLYNE